VAVAPRTVPVMPTESPGLYITSALYNASVKGLGDFLTAPPVFSAYQGTTQAIGNNSFTSATLDTERTDPDGGHSTVTNTSRYTFQVAGWYLALGVAAFANTSTAGSRAAKLLMNGTTAVPSSEQLTLPTTTTASTVPTFALVQANVNDYIELQIYQNSGGSLNTAVNLTGWDWSTSMTLLWVST
jgi:hypothetical protein